MPNFNILVTGGAGYIGGHFVNKARKINGYKIYVVDDFRCTKNNVLNDPNVKYFELNICDRNKLNAIFKENRIDVVAHFAASASVPDSVVNPGQYYDNNLTGALSLFNCAKENGVRKIIFSSSSSVYGNQKKEFISEDDPKNPENPYGRTKLITENILSDYSKAYGMDSISFRYYCASGCDESLEVGEWHTPETHIIPVLIKTALGKQDKFVVYGNDYPTRDGSGVRDYTHVNDIASAHIRALDILASSEGLCKFYNIGTNRGYSVLELIGVMERVSGKKIPYIFSSRRPGDPASLIPDCTYCQKDMKWQAEYNDIEKTISTAYKFFLNKAEHGLWS